MGAAVKRVVATSGDNAVGAASSATGRKLRIKYATVAYSAAPTQAGVTVTLNAGAGAGYDTILFTGAANTRHNFFQPTTELDLDTDDVIDVSAPAGGAGITSAIAIFAEELGD